MVQHEIGRFIWKILRIKSNYQRKKRYIKIAEKGRAIQGQKGKKGGPLEDGAVRPGGPGGAFTCLRGTSYCAPPAHQRAPGGRSLRSATPLIGLQRRPIDNRPRSPASFTACCAAIYCPPESHPITWNPARKAHRLPKWIPCILQYTPLGCLYIIYNNHINYMAF